MLRCTVWGVNSEFKMTNFALKMMNSVFKMMNSTLIMIMMLMMMMNSTLMMMNFAFEQERTGEYTRGCDRCAGGCKMMNLI